MEHRNLTADYQQARAVHDRTPARSDARQMASLCLVLIAYAERLLEEFE